LRFLVSLGRYLLAVLITLFMVEVFLQVGEIQSPMEYVIDPKLGPTYRENLPFSRFSEGFFLGQTNEWGGLGEGRPPRAEGGERRILIHGDSFALGHTVLERQHFATMLGPLLGRQYGDPVIALNFARADYCLWNMWQHHVDLTREWDHDLALFLVDDSDFAPLIPADPAMYPFSQAVEGSLVVNYDFVHSEKHALFKRLEPALTHMATPRMVFNAMKTIDSGEFTHQLLGKLVAPPEPVFRPLIPPNPPPVADTTRLIMMAMADDPRCVVVLRNAVHPMYLQLLDDLGVRVVDMAPLIRSLEESGHDPFWWPVTRRHGHWNYRSHEAIARYLAEQITVTQLMEPRS